MTGLFILSSIPGTESPDNAMEALLLWVSPSFQNLLHTPVYAGLTYSWFWAFLANNQRKKYSLFLAIFCSLIYAFFDEIYQTYMPGRYGSLTDLLLDALGIGLAAFFILKLQPVQKECDNHSS
jgi:VanZ family protein